MLGEINYNLSIYIEVHFLLQLEEYINCTVPLDSTSSDGPASLSLVTVLRDNHHIQCTSTSQSQTPSR
jgi:hypothetical protein